MTRCLLALGLVLVACAPTTLLSIGPGYGFANANMGVLIVRMEYVDTDGKRIDQVTGLLVSGNELPIRLIREGDGEELRFSPVNEGGAADFHMELAPGWYRQVIMTGAGFTERWYVVRYHVEPGVVSYAGMLRYTRNYLKGSPSFTPWDEYDAAVARFRASHPQFRGEIKKSLLELNTARGRVLEEQPWQGPAHENPPY